MSAILHNAARVKPPRLESDVVVLASATSSGRLRIPASWLGSYITVQAEGADVYVGFSTDASAAVDRTATTTVTSEVPNFPATLPQRIPNGSQADFDLSLLEPLSAGQFWRLVHISSATGGYIRIIRSSGPASR